MMLSFDFHLLSFVVLTGVLWVLYKLLLEGRVPVRVVYAYLLVGMVATAGVSMLSPVRLMPSSGTEAAVAATAEGARRYLTVSQIIEGSSAGWWLVENGWRMAYVGGAALVLLYVFVQLVALRRFKRVAVRRYDLPGLRGVQVYEGLYDAPFSYGRSIFLPADLPEGELHDMVLRHERSHLTHRHFAQLLLFQLWVALNWFNPFMWLWFFSLKRVQEMEVDTDLLRQGVDRRQYQLSLLQLCVLKRTCLSLHSNYFYSPLKLRILFMNRRQRRVCWRLTGAAAVVLVAAGVALACQTRRDNPLRGTWELVGVVDPHTGRVKPAAVRQLKFVGNESFFTMAFLNDSINDTSILFQGSGGSYEYVNDTLVRERSMDCPVRQMGTDRFRMTWRNLGNRQEPYVTEEWRRIETPPSLEKYWEIVQ